MPEAGTKQADRAILVVGGGLLAALLLAAGLASAAQLAPHSVQGKTTLLEAALGGAAVVPGPGDPDGSAKAEVSARPGEHKICVRMVYEPGVGRATAIHIHEVGSGQQGSAIATLYEEVGGGAPGPSLIIGCEGKMPKPLVRRVAKHPRSFYIDLHTLDFPDGALRGQLHK
jgi:CHRD domain